MAEFDALVVGAGISGCATAIELMRAGWRVGMLHCLDRVSAVESLSPMAMRRLEALTIETASFLTEIVAWWGSDREVRAHHAGARTVQRTAVADALRSRAAEAGAVIIEQGKLNAIKRLCAGWELTFKTTSGCNRRLNARYLVDATGRASAVGKRVGARRATFDQLFCASMPVSDVDLAGTWTESVSDGWWNLCCAGGEGTLSFYSIASVIRHAKRGFGASFYKTRQLRRLLPVPRFGACTIRPAGSSRLAPCAGTGWVSVGDAASTLQPLASAGVTKALRDARLVRHALERAPDEYDRLQLSEFTAYLQALSEHYRLERRWPQNPLWMDYLRPLS